MKFLGSSVFNCDLSDNVVGVDLDAVHLAPDELALLELLVQDEDDVPGLHVAGLQLPLLVLDDGLQVAVTPLIPELFNYFRFHRSPSSERSVFKINDRRVLIRPPEQDVISAEKSVFSEAWVELQRARVNQVTSL